jgi:hypothetical protein
LKEQIYVNIHTGKEMKGENAMSVVDCDLSGIYFL